MEISRKAEIASQIIWPDDVIERLFRPGRPNLHDIERLQERRAMLVGALLFAESGTDDEAWISYLHDTLSALIAHFLQLRTEYFTGDIHD